MPFLDKETPPSARVFVLAVCLPAAAVLLNSGVQSTRIVLQGDFEWMVLLLLTILGSCFPVRLPAAARDRGILVTAGDLFIFLALLLYGTAIAVVIAGADAVFATLKDRQPGRSWGKSLFNVGQFVLVIFVVGRSLEWMLGETAPLMRPETGPQLGFFFGVLSAVAILYSFLNSGAVALAMALESQDHVWTIWRANFVWVGLTDLAGALAAGIVFLNLHDTLLVIGVLSPVFLVTYYSFRMNRRRIEALTNSRRFLQSTLDSVSAGVAILDERGRVIAVNRSWEKFSVDGELAGLCCLPGEDLMDSLDEQEGIDSDIGAQIKEGVLGTIDGPRGDFTLEYCNGDAQNSRWFSLNAHRFEDEDRLRIALEFEEITTQKQLEEQLRHSQKMEAVGRLAGGIAHDFNNILTIISGYGTFLRQSVGDDQRLRGHVETILEAADRAAAVTRQMLAFSRRQVLDPQVLDHNTLVEDNERLLRRLIGEDVHLTTSLYPAAGSVRVDPGQYSQVLMNLAVNARDAMPRGGRLHIETATADMTENPRYGLSPGLYAIVRVIDDGEGMSRETLDKVFEPFFSTKDVSKGTGLGLSTVYGIVRQSGGTVNVQSAVGKGAVFEIYLPLVVSVDDSADLPVELDAASAS